MNKWQIDGNSIEKWPAGGGIAYDSHNGKHTSIHPEGRTATYRSKNKHRHNEGRRHA